MKWIFAVDQNWNIGYRGDLLVRIPEDLQRFKEMTWGQILLMGRKTFMSLAGGKPLPGRVHIVLTQQEDFSCDGVYVVSSKEEAKELISRLLKEEKREVFLIGGGHVASQFLEETEEAYITHVEAVFPADTCIPNLLEEGFHVRERSPLYHGEVDYYYAHYVRGEKNMQNTWDLSKIYESDQAFEEDLALLQEQAKGLPTFKGKLLESPDCLLEALELRLDIGRKLEKLFMYSHLHHDSDTRVSRYQNYQAQLMGVHAQIMALGAYFEPELLAASWKQIEDFLSAKEELKLYEQFLRDLFRNKDHVLDEKSEEILASFSESLGAPSTIFSYLNNADLRFPKIMDERGEEVELTHGNFIPFLEKEDRVVRKNAYEAFYKVFMDHENTLASTLYHHVKTGVLEAKTRNFPSTRAYRLHDNNIPEAVYDSLIQSVHDALPAMKKYLELRKKYLGVDQLHFYDVYAPLVKEVNYVVTYEEAKDLVVKALAPLGEDYVKVVEEALRDRWIDVYERPGKRSGAYSSGSYDTVPYMLLNHQDNVSNLFTLAHEMGHSLHSYLSKTKQPYVYSHYGIFLAEIASTFNEALLNHYLLEREQDPMRRLYLINHYLETFKGTIFRQTMFAEFEREIYAHVEQGQGLTSQWLCEEYGKINDVYFSGMVDVDEEIKHEWSRIPHFYYNFYVYQYATGLSAATSFAKRVLDGEEGALEGYLGFLSAGCSDYPVEVLKKAGLDMSTPRPVQEALAVFTSLVDEFERLLEAQ